MIHGQTHVEPYHAFRFCLILPGSAETVEASVVHHDPFLRGMWIGRGHLQDRPVAASLLTEHKKIDVYMLSRGNQNCRKVTVEYDGIDWYPIDLDASNSGVAMEWVLLKDAKYTSCEEVKFEDLGEEIMPMLRIGDTPKKK